MKVATLLTALLFVFQSAYATQQLQPTGRFARARGVEYNDIWGWTAPDGREYALLGVNNGTSIVDVTDSQNLKEITFIPSSKSIWKDIKTYQNYAYVVNETGGGLQIIDLSQLPQKAELVATYTGFSTSHNIYIDTDRALLFAEGDHAQPVRILSLKNPTAPVQLSFLGVECHDIYARNGLLYVSEGGHGTIGVFDYNDPKNPKLAGRFQIKRAGYVHNAWLSDDGKYLMTTEENNNKTIKMFDVSDLNNVQQVDEILADGKIAHNAHIKGNYAYVSHYGSGLRIYDVSNPARLSEAAFWLRGSSSERGMVSAWGAYPFLKSGKVLVSDIEEGLVVVEFEGARE